MAKCIKEARKNFVWCLSGMLQQPTDGTQSRNMWWLHRLSITTNWWDSGISNQIRRCPVTLFQTWIQGFRFHTNNCSMIAALQFQIALEPPRLFVRPFSMAFFVQIICFMKWLMTSVKHRFSHHVDSISNTRYFNWFVNQNILYYSQESSRNQCKNNVVTLDTRIFSRPV